MGTQEVVDVYESPIKSLDVTSTYLESQSEHWIQCPAEGHSFEERLSETSKMKSMSKTTKDSVSLMAFKNYAVFCCIFIIEILPILGYMDKILQSLLISTTYIV